MGDSFRHSENYGNLHFFEHTDIKSHEKRYLPLERDQAEISSILVQQQVGMEQGPEIREKIKVNHYHVSQILQNISCRKNKIQAQC